MTTAILRLLCAIAISPIVPGVVLWIIVSVLKERPSGLLWINVSALVGYPSLIVLALPLCYLFLRRGWLKLWHFFVLGGFLGLLAFFMLDIVAVMAFSKPGAGHGHGEGAWIQYRIEDFVSFLEDYGFFLPVFAIGGMISSGCFWAILRPSFPTWRRCIQRKAPA